MAQASQTAPDARDQRFYYEPMLAAHPRGESPRLRFADAEFSFPLWISSMTGGTRLARTINANMARACAEFGLGMGLGSCRPLLEDPAALADFDVRDLMPGRPLYANLGVAQVEELLGQGQLGRVHKLVEALRADGLVIHVNPLQEWYQPGGDVFRASPLETVTRFLEEAPYPVMVKEVGHGMGPASLRALMALPLAAIEFAAFGGTNFSVLESRRSGGDKPRDLALVGHTAQEMAGFVREILASGAPVRCRSFIVSGGVADALQGLHLLQQLPAGNLFGMAQGVLRHAQGDYAELRAWLTHQSDMYAMAAGFLRAKPKGGEG